MIFGNPRVFAISVQPVSYWSDASFVEGIFDIYLMGIRLSDSKVRSNTLTIHARDLENSLLRQSIVTIPVKFSGLDDLATLIAFEQYSYPKLDVDSLPSDYIDPWEYVFAPHALTDIGFHLFAYREGDCIFFIGGKSSAGIVGRSKVDLEECRFIAQQALEYAESFRKEK